LCELVTCVEIDEADLRASLETLKPNRPPARPPLGDDMLSRLSDDRAFMVWLGSRSDMIWYGMAW
ncbi:hypothetical protein SARC_15368, partial [Sphaeroforma arctica JP610]